jgi:hypothetical protein
MTTQRKKSSSSYAIIQDLHKIYCGIEILDKLGVLSKRIFCGWVCAPHYGYFFSARRRVLRVANM